MTKNAMCNDYTVSVEMRRLTTHIHKLKNATGTFFFFFFTVGMCH